MSRLLVVTRPELASGFHLAGVEAFAAANADAARQLIDKWLESGETGLLAVDEDLLSDFDAAFRQRLAAAEQLPHLALPGGRLSETSLSGRRRIAAMLRHAVGVHITFHGEQM
jgi:V/A-type H+-transporting ATPase subunit F